MRIKINKCNIGKNCEPYLYIISSIDYEYMCELYEIDDTDLIRAFNDFYNNYFHPQMQIFCKDHLNLFTYIDNNEAEVFFDSGEEYFTFCQKFDKTMKIFYNYDEALVYYNKLYDWQILS